MRSASLLPRSLNEVTPKVINDVLAARYPASRVATVQFSDVTQGTGTRARMTLGYEPGRSEGLPATMWLKSSFNELTAQMESWQTLETEARFYDLSDSIAVRAPRAFGSSYDGSGQCLLLLEDLVRAGVRFGHVSAPMTWENVGAVLDELARFHASLWESPRLEADLKWFPSPVHGPLAEFYLHDLTSFLPRAVRGSRSDLLAGPLIDADLMAEAWHVLQTNNAKRPHCLLHYDAHVGNTYIDTDGSGGLLDWACARRGLWAHDVNYFLVSALSIRDRRRWEADLLRRYLAEIERRGVTPQTFDEAWAEYIRQPLFGLMMWLFTTQEMQPEEVCRASISRFAAAILDYDTLRVLTGH